MARALVNRVDVRPLFPIDFDIDHQIVHDGGDFFVFGTLVRHHMAPMACGITNRQKKGPFSALAPAKAASPHAIQWTGLSLCWGQVGAGLVLYFIFEHRVAPVAALQ